MDKLSFSGLAFSKRLLEEENNREWVDFSPIVDEPAVYEEIELNEV